MTNLAEDVTKDATTPMLAQYHKIKEQHPGCLLFFRLGDFYEMFYEDAITASNILEIALTRRGKQAGQDIPMCGVPYHASESYIARLIKAGYKVAICEQLEDPQTAKKRDGYKAVVKRDVIRIITPGTLTEETFLPGHQHNFLMAVAMEKSQFGVGAIDISTGEFFLESPDEKSLKSCISRFFPSEILISQSLYQDPKVLKLLEDWKSILTPQSNSRFDKDNGKRRLEETFKVKTLDGFGDFGFSEIKAGGALIEYVHLTQKGKMPRILPPIKHQESSILYIDGSTQRNLELVHTLSGQKKGSLLDTIDLTVTAGGARLLYRNLLTPSRKLPIICDRQEQIAYFVSSNTRSTLREHLKSMPDLERILSRITVGRSGPRDLGAIKIFLESVEKIQGLFLPLEESLPMGLKSHINHLNFPQDLLDILSRGLKDTLPVNARDGNFIASGYSTEFDELIQFRDQGRDMILKLQTQYAHETSIPTLKIKYNNMIGYYIEISPSYKGRLPEDIFIHRQTLMGSMRYTTSELIKIQEKILNAGEQALALELKLFQKFIEQALNHHDQLGKVARHMAQLDFISALAELSVQGQYIRPQVNEGQGLNIIGGRHPVVEQSLTTSNQGPFTPNDCKFDDQQNLLLLTGPNMAGKSTYLRQNALIIILAQMGSFVPADSAEIGLVDRIFSRVGASDDLARGHSTFMVEMVETATILNQATEKSFVILDEIGRGTSTFDGLSLAWAVVEYLHTNIQCRSLFATHYHELTALKTTLSKLACYTIKIQEWEGDVVFLHQVIPGTADKSYGIHVAKLAGLPVSVLKRADAVLKELESQKSTPNIKQQELPFIDRTKNVSVINSHHQQVFDILKDVNPDQLTPKDALDFLYNVKEKMKEQLKDSESNKI